MRTLQQKADDLLKERPEDIGGTLDEIRKVVRTEADRAGLGFTETNGPTRGFPFDGYPERKVLSVGDYYLIYITDPEDRLRGRAHTHRRTKTADGEQVLVSPWRVAVAQLVYDLRNAV